jgi:hypothetical protein
MFESIDASIPREAIEPFKPVWRNHMKLNLSKVIAAALLTATASAAFAQETVQNIDPYRHGNLAAAQNLVRGAFDKLSEAQYANHDALGGHAARAKELLREAADEIKSAAVTANQR